VSLAGWVAGQAAPSEILVSGTVKDLVAGAGLRFADRGTRSLAGVQGEWRLFALLPAAEDTDPRPSPLDDAGRTRSLPPHAALTRREREVLPLVAQGLSNLEIADMLSIGERTVESHVSSILAKRGLATRTQLAAAATGGDAPPRR